MDEKKRISGICVAAYKDYTFFKKKKKKPYKCQQTAILI